MKYGDFHEIWRYSSGSAETTRGAHYHSSNERYRDTYCSGCLRVVHFESEKNFITGRIIVTLHGYVTPMHILGLD